MNDHKDNAEPGLTLVWAERLAGDLAQCGDRSTLEALGR
jgi:hypothetical protein